MQSNFKEARVLVGEDSADDLFFLRRALDEIGFAGTIFAVEDGREVTRYLQGEGQYCDREKHPFPDALILDVKMPAHDGFYVLEWLKEHPDYKVVPTMIFSSAVVETDARRVYELGANAYLLKPTGYKELAETLRAAWAFWSVAQRPTARARRAR